MELIYLLTVIITIGLVMFLIKRYNLTRYQVMIFILLVLFWSSVIIIRAYRKSYAYNPTELGGLALGSAAAAVIASGYGFISIFARFSIFYLSDVFHSRKLLIGIGLAIIGLTSYWVFVDPNYTSLLMSSLALGIGASMLSLFNVFFAQTFDPKQAMMSVSILSVAPLLAEFIMSAFQANYTIVSQENYSMLWLLSLVLAVVSIVFLVFVKDNKPPNRVMTSSSLKKVLSNRNIYFFGIIAILVSVIKFATSGSNLITYFQSDIIQMSSGKVAYSDFVFSVSQMIAGVLAGLTISKRIGLKSTLSLGIILGIVFNIILIFSTNTWLLFFSSILSGFGYGLTYNSLIGLTLESVDVDLREMNMAIFQTFFAIGIFYGDYIYKIILNFIGEVSEFQMYQSIFWVILILSVLLLMLTYFGLKINERVNKDEITSTVY